MTYILGEHVAEEVDGVGNEESAAEGAGVAAGQVRDHAEQRLDAKDDASLMEK